MNRNAVALLFLACVLIMFGARLLGPSALERYDQPRTVAYTADMVVNGNWLLPRDMLGNPATKPPLVNWLAAPLVRLGFWTEWAVKLPMLLASLATLALTVWSVHLTRRDVLRHLPNSMGEAPSRKEWGRAEARPSEVGLLAGIAWLVNPANINMIYHCRPDPVLVVFLTGAWILGTRIVADKQEPGLKMLVGFWLCVGLAALTKGPAALLPIIYLPLAARLIGGNWFLLHRSRWWWGLPVTLAVFGAWAIPCALRHSDEFFRVLVGREFIAQTFGFGDQLGSKRDNITSAGPVAAIITLWQNPGWFVTRFAPWSLASIGALFLVGWRNWFRHPLAPAILWFLLVLVFFSLSAHKTADYILPAYPAAALLASWFLLRYFRALYVSAAAVCLALGLAVESIFFSASARTREGENVKEFARAVQAETGGELVVFANSGFNTLQFFLGSNQPTRTPTPAQLATARWIITPVLADAAAVRISKPLPTKPKSKRIVLGLYRLDDVRGRSEIVTSE